MEFLGKGISKGVVIGRVLRYEPFVPQLTKKSISPQDVSFEVSRYQEAKKLAIKQLESLEKKLKADDPEKAKIMTAHIDIINDPVMEQEIIMGIKDSLFSPEVATDEVYGNYALILGKSKNVVMKERASDLVDVKLRLLRCFGTSSSKDLSSLSSPVIVVADDLFPSDTVALDRDNVLGIVTQIGGGTSHTAIIAKSYSIPSVLGVLGIMDCLTDNQTIILDAADGRVIVDPTQDEIELYSEKKKKLDEIRKLEKTYLGKQALTSDGKKIEMLLNVASSSKGDLTGIEYSDGCGLFRTEFLFLNENQLPNEQQQYLEYKKILTEFNPKSVVLRTMDIGGDKQHKSLDLEKEQNPFLGVRGLRLSLEKTELFRTQIRAALRASVYGNLKIMLPMVGGLEEFRLAKSIIKEQQQYLTTSGIDFASDIKIGVMVEVPSIAIISDLVADEVDFASIGTNDLTQYICAADRLNPGVKSYYKEYHPALFRLIKNVVQSFDSAGKPVSICGELASDPLAIPLLIGLGVKKLSMSFSSFPQALRIIADLSLSEAKDLSEQILMLKTDQEIKQKLSQFFEFTTKERNRYV